MYLGSPLRPWSRVPKSSRSSSKISSRRAAQHIRPDRRTHNGGVSTRNGCSACVCVCVCVCVRMYESVNVGMCTQVQWQQLSEKKRAKVLRWRENVARIEALNAATVRKAQRDEILREQMLGRVPCEHVESAAVFAARAADNESRVHLLEALQVCLFPKHVNLCKYGSSVSIACTSGPPGIHVSDICMCTRETSIHVSDIRAPLVYMCRYTCV